MNPDPGRFVPFPSRRSLYACNDFNTRFYFSVFPSKRDQTNRIAATSKIPAHRVKV